MNEKIMAFAVKHPMALTCVALGTSALVTFDGSGNVLIGDTEVAQVQAANASYLTTAYSSFKLLGAIAGLAAGFYVINKVFSIIPKVGGGK